MERSKPVSSIDRLLSLSFLLSAYLIYILIISLCICDVLCFTSSHRQNSNRHRQTYTLTYTTAFCVDAIVSPCGLSPVLKLLKMATGMRALLDTVVQALPQVCVISLSHTYPHTHTHTHTFFLSQGHTGVN